MACTNSTILVRSLSTSSLNLQLIKPPLQLFGIDGRYATALYSAASKSNALEAVEKDLIKFEESLKNDARLREFIGNPTIKRLQKAQALKSVAEKGSLSAQTSNLLQVLAENGRLMNLEGIIQAYKLIMSAHRGELICEVITAKELDSEQRQHLETVLKSFLKENQTLQLTVKVQPSIVGGMIVHIGDRYVDMSVASKIKKYKDLITTDA